MLTLEKAKQKFRHDRFAKEDEKLYISNPKDIMRAIEKAYQSMTLRTIKGLGKVQNLKESCCEKLCENFTKYFGGKAPTSQKEFNEIHADICNKFLNFFNGELEKNDVSVQCFGKAQKIVNMSFKYLFCFDDAEDKKQWFQYCHVPLDTFTLNWYQSISEARGNDKYVWSNLDKDTYDTIQSDIVAFLLPSDGMHRSQTLPVFPLEAEFLIWSYERRIADCKSLLSHLGKYEKDVYFKECTTIPDEFAKLKNQFSTEIDKLKNQLSNIQDICGGD